GGERVSGIECGSRVVVGKRAVKLVGSCSAGHGDLAHHGEFGSVPGDVDPHLLEGFSAIQERPAGKAATRPRDAGSIHGDFSLIVPASGEAHLKSAPLE